MHTHMRRRARPVAAAAGEHASSGRHVAASLRTRALGSHSRAHVGVGDAEPIRHGPARGHQQRRTSPAAAVVEAAGCSRRTRACCRASHAGGLRARACRACRRGCASERACVRGCASARALPSQPDRPPRPLRTWQRLPQASASPRGPFPRAAPAAAPEPAAAPRAAPRAGAGAGPGGFVTSERAGTISDVPASPVSPGQGGANLPRSRAWVLPHSVVAFAQSLIASTCSAALRAFRRRAWPEGPPPPPTPPPSPPPPAPSRFRTASRWIENGCTSRHRQTRPTRHAAHMRAHTRTRACANTRERRIAATAEPCGRRLWAPCRLDIARRLDGARADRLRHAL
jgi:hypothetical protein